MIWKVKMETIDKVRTWTDQQIKTQFLDVDITIEIKDKKCVILLDGKSQNVERAFYIVWEVLFLYDGYFYKPMAFTVDGEEKEVDSLIKVAFYQSGWHWIESSILLGRAERDLSKNILIAFDKMRNEGKNNGKMTKSVINAFFYLHSEGYEKIISDHRLSLYLNLCDGFVNNTFKETNNVKQNVERVIKKALNTQKILYGLSLLGINRNDFCYVLAQERHEVDHYIYKNDSLATYVFNSEEKARHYIIWYFTYIVELALRVSFLSYIGVDIKNEYKDYAMDVINDWIIYENDFSDNCVTPGYQYKQFIKKAQRTISKHTIKNDG